MRTHALTLTPFHWLAVILGLTFALMSATAMARATPNPKKLEPITFDLSGRKFVLPVPRDGLSKDVQRFKPLPSVNLDDLSRNEQKWIYLLDELWDWPAGFLFGIHGSLNISVLVYAASADVEVDCEADLRRMVQAQLVSELNHFKEVGGQERFMPRLTLLPDAVPLTSNRALVYTDKGFNDRENYVIPVTNRSYLIVRFIFFDQSYPKRNMEWRQTAGQMKDAILSGMRFEGDWSPLRSCSP